ncbi:ATP-dependent RNA helicase HrpA [Nocardia vaccinii]|uniref:ATP-dependent RNA helicase HrpA n=1 Tax=Nocardia vaccinii TaxID=1822 RepID=UPI000A5A0E84|nr:ATP-dependent RNA helicase HrpA [Nocardia vaccinii]
MTRTAATTRELRTRLAELSIRDEHRLRRRLDKARGGDLADIENEITAAEGRIAARRAAVPQIRYPEQLPVSARRDDIAAAIAAHQVVVIAGETGSGKTTQIPKICLELGRGIRGTIGHTQPRRLAARTVAERIAEELGTELGDVVGYTVRFTDQASDRTLVKLMTDGILLAEIQRDRMLRRYDTIIIDEAHERSLNIDFLLGYLKQLLPKRPDLKVVITSATIDPDLFARHFGTQAPAEQSGTASIGPDTSAGTIDVQPAEAATPAVGMGSDSTAQQTDRPETELLNIRASQSSVTPTNGDGADSADDATAIAGDAARPDSDSAARQARQRASESPSAEESQLRRNDDAASGGARVDGGSKGSGSAPGEPWPHPEAGRSIRQVPSPGATAAAPVESGNGTGLSGAPAESSATVLTAAPIVEVSGRSFPVEVRYRPLSLEMPVTSEDLDDEDTEIVDRDPTDAIGDAVRELLTEGDGDILVFLSGEREIRDAADTLRDMRLPRTEILPLYARLSAAEQHRVFEPHTGRRVVLATNVAETSLTVPGIRYVIDPGTARISRYSLRTKVQRLPIEPISQASARQRSGRCGRVADGIAIRLYSEEDFESRPKFTEPEILRTNLAAVILQMTALGLGDIESFPFVEPPDSRAIRDGVALLEELGALTRRDDRDRAGAASGRALALTPIGREMAQIPVDPRMARMLVEAQRGGCLSEVLVIVAALSIQDVRERPVEHQQAADAQHARFTVEGSDFLSYLRLWDYLREQRKALSTNQFRRMCRDEFLHYLRIREWQDLHGQLRTITRGLGWYPDAESEDAATVSGERGRELRGAGASDRHRGSRTPESGNGSGARRSRSGTGSSARHRVSPAPDLAAGNDREPRSGNSRPANADTQPGGSSGSTSSGYSTDNERSSDSAESTRMGRGPQRPGKAGRDNDSRSGAGKSASRDGAQRDAETRGRLEAPGDHGRRDNDAEGSGRRGRSGGKRESGRERSGVQRAGRADILAANAPEPDGLPWDVTSIHQALLAGMLSHIGVREAETREFLGARNAKFMIFPGSSLAKKPPRWVMAAELVETSRLWGRTAARIEPEWAERLAGDLVKRTYSEPHWSAKRGAAAAYERVTLYGIPLVVQRRVEFGRIDPELSRELFIRHALVQGEWQTRHEFFARNRELLEDVADLEHRARRRDILVDDQVLFDFYDERIPADVVSVRHFDSWWRTQRRKEPNLLDFTASTVVNDDAAVLDPAAYPDGWRQGELSFPLTYQFEPGQADDGVTAHIPVAQLAHVRAVGFDWLVPGMREELAAAWIKTLPKHLRRSVVPAPDFARAALAQLTPRAEPLRTGLARELSRLGSVTVRPADLNPAALPDHLRMTFAATAPDGTIVDRDKDLAALKTRLADQVSKSVARATAAAERPASTVWTSESLGALPPTVRREVGGQTITGYPALVPEGTGVAVRVLASPAAQAAAMRTGTRVLLLNQLPASARAATAGLSPADRLALSQNPSGSLDALIEDCRACAADELVAENGGPVRGPEEFKALVERIRPQFGAAVARIVRLVVPVLTQAHHVRGALASTADREIAEDVRHQLDDLVFAGFVTEFGSARLRELPRYLQAAVLRLEALPASATRDRQGMAELDRVHAAYQRLLDALPEARRTGRDVTEIWWMIEELRVSLFAQQLGTPYPVSAKRIERAITAVRTAPAARRTH